MFILYPDLSMQERLELLNNQAVKKEMRNYARSLQQSEVDNQRTQYANDAMALEELETQLENIKKDYAARIKNLEGRMVERLGKIKTGKETVSGTLYGIANHAEKRMMWYEGTGELIDSRELLPDEQQGRLFIDAAKVAAGSNPDLPLETQGVVNTILKEQAGKPGAQGEHIDFEDVFEHNEAGWEKMNDEQLVKKYGTVDISVIRTMVEQDGKWYAPGKEPKAASPTPQALNSKVQETGDEAKKRADAQSENATKNRRNNNAGGKK